MRRLQLLAAAAAALLLSGCAAPGQLVEVNVPVPVECRENEPARPAMPSDGLREGVSLTAQVQALLAEIEIRDGYELRLLTALQACRRPIDTSATAAAAPG